MSFDDRPTLPSENPFLPELPDFKGGVRAVVTSPVLLLAAIIHLLCRTSTKRLLLGIVLLDVPLQWGIHLDFRPSISALGSIGGYDVSITTVALFGLYASWFFTSSALHQPLRPLWNWPIAVYTATVFCSVIVASDIQLSLFYSFILIQMLLLYLYLSANITSRNDIEFVITVLIVGGLLESIYIIALAILGRQFGLMPQQNTQSVVLSVLGLKTVIFLPVKDVPFVREGGTIGSPNYAAGYLSIIIALAFCIRRIAGSAGLRRFTIPTITAALFALFLTFSRGGWTELVFSLAIIVVARWKRSGISSKAALTVAAAVVVAIGTLYLNNPISDRLFSPDNGSAQSRVPLMNLAYHMIVANPTLGIGANNFAAVMTSYAGPEFRHAWLYTVHNQFFLVCAETGMMGLIAYLWVYFSIARRGWKLWKGEDSLFAPVGLAIAAGICGLMLHMLVDIFSERGLLQLSWIFMAVLAASEMLTQQESADKLAQVESVSDSESM